MSIRIVTDSTCDLPQAVVDEYRITVVPVYVNVDGRSLLDGVELSRGEFYEQLPQYRSPPRTSAPGPGTFTDLYERLAAEGADAILSIHVSSAISNMYNVACLGAEAAAAVPVTVLDSQQLTLGTGLVVLEAARAVSGGHSVEEIVDLLEDLVPRVYSFAALDTLEFLRRSGRVTWVRAGLGTLLRIKPLLRMHEGQMTLEPVRTRRRAVQRLVEMVSGLGPLQHLSVVHTHVPERAAELRKRVRHLFPSGEAAFCEEVTPAIGAHVGPGAVGLVAVAAVKG